MHVAYARSSEYGNTLKVELGEVGGQRLCSGIIGRGIHAATENVILIPSG